MSQEIQHLSERWWWGSVQSYGRPTPPPNSCLNTHTHTHTSMNTTTSFQIPWKETRNNTLSLSACTYPTSVWDSSQLSVYVYVCVCKCVSVSVSVCVCVRVCMWQECGGTSQDCRVWRAVWFIFRLLPPACSMLLHAAAALGPAAPPASAAMC